MSEFAERVVAWQTAHGRRDLPWQDTRDPYRVWLSEIMLQQTQVATVVDYYARFLQRFPDVANLAAAPLADVMRLWAGLGYYSRARNLHACARRVVTEHGGEFPRDAQALARLPGIGRSTAAAIAAFCFGERAAILDGNVKRVLARHFGIEGFPGAAAVERRLWQLAGELLPQRRAMPAYTQGLMDLGATVCTRARPRCEVCPVAPTCVALRTRRVTELPAPRPRKPVPTRRVQMLIAVHDGAVLVEERPPAGVWGGLLALPQFDSAAALRAALRALADGARARRLPARRHAFTHFTLEFTPHVVRLARIAQRAAEPGAVWLPLVQIESAALPTPIRALLRDVRSALAAPKAARARHTPAVAPPKREERNDKETRR
ncbi:A/G-specific adenine glycosylase [Betaproteobacteria bacterium PRO7]|jgi:A/G-specific adenine glycosylase|nr:A/G-specific adenine glycosylase [Betaproteobacteria bacterium PRO7]